MSSFSISFKRLTQTILIHSNNVLSWHSIFIHWYLHLFIQQTLLAHQAPLSMGFSRQEYWSVLPFPSSGDLPDPRIKPRSPTLQADVLTSEPPGRLVITFLSKNKCLLISWLHSPSTRILETPPNKVCHSFHCFPSELWAKTKPRRQEGSIQLMSSPTMPVQEPLGSGYI